MGEIRLPVLNAYGCPMISQKMAIWENFSCPLTDLWPCTAFCSHPKQAAHNLVADLVYAFLTNWSMPRSISAGNTSRQSTTQWHDSTSDNNPSSHYRDLWIGDFLVDETKDLDSQMCFHPTVSIDGQSSVPESAADAHAGYHLGHRMEGDSVVRTNVRYSRVRSGTISAPGSSSHNQMKPYGQYTITNENLG